MRPVDVVLAALADGGLLLVQDRKLPNVVAIVTGDSLRTSWWSHPKARTVFAVLSELADHPDVLFTKLLSGKETLVHRPLWPALLAVGSAREPWQMRGLSPGARRLLSQLDRGGSPVRATGPVVKQLQSRLLATAEEVHTDSGRHEMALRSWREWSSHASCRRGASLAESRTALERAALKLGAPLGALPWTVASMDC